MKTTRIALLTMVMVFVVLLAPAIQAAFDIVIVDDGGEDDVGKFTSLAVVNGFPAISYVDDTNDRLLYVRATDASGTAWSSPVIVDTVNVRSRTKLLMVDGHPAIAYFDSAVHHLKYVRATDADGTMWGAPVIVDDSGNADWHLSATIINGKPAICYQDIQDKDLVYVQAADSQGSNWQPPVIVDETDNAGYELAMASVDGSPAVVYYHYDEAAEDDSAKYVRAVDPDGANWGTPITIDEDGGADFSLAVVDGKPAVAYWDWVVDALKYLRANDAQGESWGAPLLLDTEGRDVGLFASLAVVDGDPAIAYIENGPGTPELRFIHAEDATGNSWHSPMVVDADRLGWYLSLAAVNGSTGISYYDSVIGGLKYAQVTAAHHTVYLPLVHR